jgi:hypothetical protein
MVLQRARGTYYNANIFYWKLCLKFGKDWGKIERDSRETMSRGSGMMSGAVGGPAAGM